MCRSQLTSAVFLLIARNLGEVNTHEKCVKRDPSVLVPLVYLKSLLLRMLRVQTCNLSSILQGLGPPQSSQHPRWLHAGLAPRS